ncbi:MAG: type II toxin-antitoxin system RelE/ParE family toxin [Nitrosomonas sp.]|nr:type II toxin-antitoxin system RelE/ParE family toxin [Nitrosomonas sp.]
MPRVIITEGAVAGLERCRLFLADKNPHAVLKAAQSIEQKLTILKADPKTGRPLNDFPEL